METNSAENIENSSKNTVINKKNEEINLLSLSVVRRDGSITPFKSDKIANAIRKAFLAQTDVRNSQNIDKSVDILTETVTAALTRRIANGDMIHIEDIQDQVELALMRVNIIRLLEPTFFIVNKEQNNAIKPPNSKNKLVLRSLLWLSRKEMAIKKIFL